MDTKNYRLIAKLAEMYYVEEKTQAEISRLMFMSRPKVSRLLKLARDLKIVVFEINRIDHDLDMV